MRRVIAPQVMIDVLYAEGVRWAGWYGPENLRVKFDQINGAFMSNGNGFRSGEPFKDASGRVRMWGQSRWTA